MKTKFRNLIACVLCLALAAGVLVPAAGAEKEKIINTVEMKGTRINNASGNTYLRWASPVCAYLGETNGKLTRVEYAGGKLLYEFYEKTGALLSAGTISVELPKFGGFFFGQTYNFAVFGQENPNDNASLEVLRVVKYSKEMKRLGAVSFYGENTSSPFEAGSLRMAESGGKLYIHTCHMMYTSQGSNNHQANMYFCINESSMTSLDKYTGIMNLSYYGYVSHSLNQFIVTDGTYVFRADQGDAYPRGISISRFSVSSATASDTISTVPLYFAGEAGVNSTGATLGGMALSGSRVLLAGSIDDQADEYTNYSAFYSTKQKNIFVISAAKSLADGETRIVRITAYDDSAVIIVGTPHLTALGNGTFLLLWEETQNNKLTVRAAVIDENGALKTQIYRIQARLSDCAPIRASDGTVYWYAGTKYLEVLYRLDPSDIGSFANTVHKWNAGSVTTPAGCETEGKRTYTCLECGAQKTEAIAPKGHTWDKGKITLAPTCIAEGEKTFTCTVCGAARKEAVEKDPSNHAGGTEIRDAVPATCRKDGYSGDTYCGGCGKKLKSGAVIDKEGRHTWIDVEIITVPTCISTGEKIVNCTTCGITQTITTDRDLTNHVGATEYRNASPATCGTDGNTGDVCCKSCGTVLVPGDRIPKTGKHNFGAWTVTKAATVSAPGEQARTCTVCGLKETEEIPKLPKADQSPDFLPGDVNQDGMVTAADARLALRATVGLEHYAADSVQFRAADVTHDGKITAADARKILRSTVGLGKLS